MSDDEKLSGLILRGFKVWYFPLKPERTGYAVTLTTGHTLQVALPSRKAQL